MSSASDNGGVYPYPLVHDLHYPNRPAPEKLLPEYTGEQVDNGPRVKGLQPGFDFPGTPLFTLTAGD